MDEDEEWNLKLGVMEDLLPALFSLGSECSRWSAVQGRKSKGDR